MSSATSNLAVMFCGLTILLYSHKPSLLSHLHSSLTYVNAHLFHVVRNYIVPTTCGIKNFDIFLILITIIIGSEIF
jgi:hypothetical protein